MFRRTAKFTLRLGVVALVAFAVKKLLEGQRSASTPAPDVEPPRPPRPAPAPKPQVVEPDPEPAVSRHEVATNTPEKADSAATSWRETAETTPGADPPQAQPEPEPEPEPEGVVSRHEVAADPPDTADSAATSWRETAETAPAPPVTPPRSTGGAKRKRGEPLRANLQEDKPERPVRANRKVPLNSQKAPSRAAMVSWVEPVGSVCPPSHPIKAKLGSKVFRRPDMPGYDASKPDRCYASDGAARRAGFNEAQR